MILSKSGYYCPLETSDNTAFECPTGYYCLDGTRWWTEYPCPVGTFNDQTTRTALSQCQNCPGGEYCAEEGLSNPSGNCQGGYYCTGSSVTATPLLGSGYGAHCEAGNYCPEGSAAMVPCDPGSYCAVNFLNVTSGLCDPGYYCTGSAVIPNPVSDPTGDICPMGSYCPQGSVSHQLCPEGTYMNSTGNDELTDCIECTAGHYCAGSGNTAPDGLCAGGWYCPGGQDDQRPTGLNCTLGE